MSLIWFTNFTSWFHTAKITLSFTNMQRSFMHGVSVRSVIIALRNYCQNIKTVLIILHICFKNKYQTLLTHYFLRSQPVLVFAKIFTSAWFLTSGASFYKKLKVKADMQLSFVRGLSVQPILS